MATHLPSYNDTYGMSCYESPPLIVDGIFIAIQAVVGRAKV